MSDIKTISDAELKAEIERRRKEKAAQERPKPVAQPDLSDLTKLCEDHLVEVEEGKEDEDTAHYIYEEAMKAVFGPKVFDWINKKSRR